MKEFIELPKNPMKDYIELSIRAEKKRKELEKQKELDFQKWLDSESRHADLSGLMPYCMFCDYCSNRVCTGHNREEECLCAKAYKAMQDRLNK